MLDYFALGLLFFVGLVLFYGVIIIHDIPYEIAKARKHPQQDALHVAGWISLFTLHTIWPFLWIWATLYREDRGWGFIPENKEEQQKISDLNHQLAIIQEKLNHSLSQEEKNAALSQKMTVVETEIAMLKQVIGKEP